PRRRMAAGRSFFQQNRRRRPLPSPRAGSTGSSTGKLTLPGAGRLVKQITGRRCGGEFSAAIGFKRLAAACRGTSARRAREGPPCWRVGLKYRCTTVKNALAGILLSQQAADPVFGLEDRSDGEPELPGNFGSRLVVHHLTPEGLKGHGGHAGLDALDRPLEV